MKFIPFTADEELTVGIMPRDGTIAIFVSGDFGSGTMSLGTLVSGTFVAFTDPAPFTINGNVAVHVGRGTTLVLSLAGSTAPDLQVGIASDFFEITPNIYKRA